jgi:hypothetical protein
MTAPGLQTAWLVQFLRLCLRKDSALLSSLGTTPDGVCRGALEIDPIGIEDNALKIYISEFPSICVREQSSDVFFAGPAQGMKAQVRVWYVMQPQAGDIEPLIIPCEGVQAHPVPAMAMADRWLRNVYWRMLYWLRVHTIGTTDLLTSGQIYRIEPPKSVRYRNVGQVALWESDLTMQYLLPPYAVTAPPDFEGVDYTLGDTADPHAGPFVESEVDL